MNAVQRQRQDTINKIQVKDNTTTEYNTTQPNTTQHNITTEHNTAQHNTTTEYNTTQHKPIRYTYNASNTLSPHSAGVNCAANDYIWVASTGGLGAYPEMCRLTIRGPY